MTDTDTLQILLGIKEDMGELKQLAQNFNTALTAHIAEDATERERVRKLELYTANQKGASRAWSAVYAAVGAIAGTAVSLFKTHHGVSP